MNRPSSGVFPRPHAPPPAASHPNRPGVVDAVAAATARLQTADSVDAVFRLVAGVIESHAGVGRGAIYLVDGRDEAVRHAFLQGPASADLSLPEIELAAMARRAIREASTVRQAGVAAGVLWAAPLRGRNAIEGIVVAVGEPDGVTAFLEHAGLALGRERGRDSEVRRRHDAEARVANLERAVDVLDMIIREGGTGSALRRITAAVSGIDGVARARLWTLRPEDGRYVETVGADRARDPGWLVPDGARRTETFVEWCSTFPRWGGFPWIPSGTAQRTGPSGGDVMLMVLRGPRDHPPLGFLVLEIACAIEDPLAIEDLQRWVSLARQAVESRRDAGTGLEDLETLREEKEQLTELHRLKSQFIAAVSHELRTPLTSITAYAETLRSSGLETDPDTRDRFLEVIHDESRRLTRIVDDILDLATMDAGRVRMSCRRVDLRDVVRDALDVIRPLAEKKNLRVTTATDEEAPVHADPDLLKQLAVNLLENATKFCDADGSVTVRLETAASAVRLVVEDDGPGIPGDKLDAIFERFFQIEARTRGRTGAPASDWPSAAASPPGTTAASGPRARRARGRGSSSPCPACGPRAARARWSPPWWTRPWRSTAFPSS
ncbi:MAG TPA: HAMP domain-containing sensor histidine kinase [bacterium]|nr:HAMP domain-containing sensor histidine kinase [bacterium]